MSRETGQSSKKIALIASHLRFKGWPRGILLQSISNFITIGGMSKFLLYLAGGLLIASTALAGEKKLMHCFAFTAQENATPADWDAFYKATNELPKKIKGLSKVWYGKLASPLQVGERDRRLRALEDRYPEGSTR